REAACGVRAYTICAICRAKRRDSTSRPERRAGSRSYVDGDGGLFDRNPRHAYVAIQVGAFGYGQVARLDIAEELGARPQHHAIASENVSAQLTHYEQSWREDLALDHSFFADHHQLDRANLAAEAALDSDRFMKDQFARDVDVAAYRDACPLLGPRHACLLRYLC